MPHSLLLQGLKFAPGLARSADDPEAPVNTINRLIVHHILLLPGLPLAKGAGGILHPELKIRKVLTGVCISGKPTVSEGPEAVIG